MGVGREPSPGGPRSGVLSNRAKIAFGALIAVLFAVGMGARGDVLPGIVGGALAGVLCFLVLRDVQRQREARRRR